MKEGYLLIDHRASPGISEDVALQLGMDPKQCGEGKMLEAATLTCSHCKSTLMKNPYRIRERNFCIKCSGHYICDGCHAEAQLPNYSHLPFEKFADITRSLGEKGIVLGSRQELLSLPSFVK